ncbi:TatD DNase family Scn1 [Schizosaccharomyces japonicus yFS275]|uniref:TatD DNase family Scn1 n=1 Tax=Schizosaccharomyces japonicus (strain yFS275 / FY16936) TaxID=402676 RepID=B6K599_SCHJY|nr:TatD DNase family Scn1 [Schizosaccharomyces japonicus yFS275]EEB08703.2 TatD DNase family Scn1 [Schizosaccharomyces japonicus yFS275]
MSAISITDVHCHLTDTPSELNLVKESQIHKCIVMSTRPFDQSFVDQAASDFPDKIIPSFGIHPWFSYLLISDKEGIAVDISAEEQKMQHYQNILHPVPPIEFMEKLPEPIHMNVYLERLRHFLYKHPNALIGEIGLDKSFRIPSGPYNSRSSLPQGPLSPYYVNMEHQIEVFEQHMNLAAELQRPVSIHCVQTYDLLLTLLKARWEGHWVPSLRKQRENPLWMEAYQQGPLPFPLRICLHSYSGSPEQVEQFTDRKIPSRVYFSFSEGINSRSKGFTALLSVFQRTDC